MRYALMGGAIVLALVISLSATAILLPSWRVDASEVSRATPSQVWAWYADSERTPNWDHLVVLRRINGPFATGTSGSNKGASGPAFPWTFTDVRTDNHYTEVTRLLGATLTATHVLTPVAHGTQIDHALIMTGPLAWAYRIALYTSFKAGIHAALHRLATGAPTSGPPAHRIA